MLEQLQLLEQSIIELKERYHITATELVNLKNRLASDTSAEQVMQLQEQLESMTTTIATLDEQMVQLSSTNEALEKQINELCEQNRQLVIQNQELEAKNTLAISRAQVIQDWLTNIDNAKA